MNLTTRDILSMSHEQLLDLLIETPAILTDASKKVLREAVLSRARILKDCVSIKKEELEVWANDLALHGVGDTETANAIDAIINPKKPRIKVK